MRYPSGGVEQTLSPTQKQLYLLELFTGYDCTKLNCTRTQASVWIADLLESGAGYKRIRQNAKNRMLQLGAK